MDQSAIKKFEAEDPVYHFTAPVIPNDQRPPTPCPPGFSDHVYKVEHGVSVPLRIWRSPTATKDDQMPWVFWIHGGGVLLTQILGQTLKSMPAAILNVARIRDPDEPSEPFIKPSTRLRQLLAQDGICVQAAGVYDGICARIAIEEGFQVIYQTGSMTTATRLGKTDLGFASLKDYAFNGLMIANLDRRIPLIADADVGFGSAPSIAHMVQMYDACGISAFHIEDGIGKPAMGKQVCDMETWRSRIRACVIGRSQIYGDSDIIIIARTDAISVKGEGFQAALDRLVAARECGADMGFIEAIESEEQIMDAVKAIHPMPFMINVVSGGKTPWLSMKRLGEIGVKLAIFAGTPGKTVVPNLREPIKGQGKMSMTPKRLMGYDTTAERATRV